MRRRGSSLLQGRNPLWTSAPLVLRHYPAALAAFSLAALLLTVAAAVYPLFISASASRFLRAEISKPLVTRYGAGISYRSDNVPLALRAPRGGPAGPAYEVRGQVFRDRVAESPDLGKLVATALGPAVTLAPADHPAEFRSVRLFAGTDAVRHVEVLRGRDGPGVWLPDLVADALGLEPGEHLRLGYRRGASVRVAVDGVYDALYSSPPGGYWLRWYDDIYPPCADCGPPPQFVLADRNQLLTLYRRLGAESVSFAWHAPLANTRLTLDDARAIEQEMESFHKDVTDRDSYLGRLFECCHRASIGLRRTMLTSSMDEVIPQVTDRMAAIEGPGLLLRVAGIVVALAAIVGATAFGLAARRSEQRLFFATGMRPVAVAAKASLESVVPCLIGGAVGVGLAFVAVGAFAPEGELSRSSIRAATLAGMLAVLGSVLVIGVVSGAGALRHGDAHGSRFGLVARLPWEVALLGIALYSYRQIQSEGAVVVDTGVSRPSVYLLAFPVAFLGGATLLGARLIREIFRSLHHRADRLRPPGYLAVRRLAGPQDLVVVLMAAVGLCIGVFVQAQTVARSLEDTIDAKAKIFVGSDVQAWVGSDTVPHPSAVPITRVTRVPQAGAGEPSDELFDLLAVDPETFPSAAYWRDGFSDLPLEEIAGRLEPDPAGPLRVVVAGRGLANLTSLDVQQLHVPVDVVGRTEVFPGMGSQRPLVVLDEEAFINLYGTGALRGSNAQTQLWLKAGRPEALQALEDLESPPFQILTASEVKDIPYITATIDTFLVLNALGLTAGLLVVAAILIYLQARQRAQVVAYGLSMRMGMQPSGHRRSLLYELAAMLVAAFALASVLALMASWLVARWVDPLAAIPPEPLLTIPTGILPMTLAALLAAAWLGAWLATRRAQTTHLGEVMRVAE